MTKRPKPAPAKRTAKLPPEGTRWFYPCNCGCFWEVHSGKLMYWNGEEKTWSRDFAASVENLDETYGPRIPPQSSPPPAKAREWFGDAVMVEDWPMLIIKPGTMKRNGVRVKITEAL